MDGQVDLISQINFMREERERNDRELKEAADARAAALQSKISKIEVFTRPSFAQPVKGSKNPKTDIRKYAGRRCRWVHIAKTPIARDVREKLSPEYIKETDALAARLREEGYKINDPPKRQIDDERQNKGTTMNLGRNAQKRLAWRIAIDTPIYLAANRDYALRLCRMY